MTEEWRPMSPDLTKPWAELPIVVLDFETTGPDPKTCEPVEVAAVRFEAGTITARFSSILKPSTPIPAEATEIHHITDEMVKDAPTLLDVAHELAQLSAGAVPCAYSSDFDRTILHRYVTATDVTLFDPAQLWLDPLVIVREVDKYERSKKLADACARHGVIIGNAHRAESDAIACGKLLHVLMRESKASMRALLDRIAALRLVQQKDHLLWRLRRWTEGATLAELERVVAGLEASP